MPPPAQQPNQLLAVALGHFQAGRLAEAEAGFRQLLVLVPGQATIAYNLAVVLKAQGRLDEAAAAYRQTLAIKPDNAKAHNNLGVVLASQGKAAESAAHYRRALAIQPDFADAHYNLGNLLRESGTMAGAVEHYRRALASLPDDPEIHNNLGIALAADGDIAGAQRHYRRALAARPDYAEAYSNLGAALFDLGAAAEAKAHYARAIAIKPAYADVHYNLGHALDAEERMDEALACYDLAVALDPMHAQAHNNLGFVAQRLGRLDEAMARYRRAQALKPDYADAHWNEALLRLLLGDFETGWRKYESRWNRKETPPRALPGPLWDGTDLTGRSILLHTEQGLGDAIQFIRYAALVKAKGAAAVIFECPKTQARLFADVAGVDQIVAAGAPLPRFDCHAPLLSLPHLLATRRDTVPADIPYLSSDPALAGAWRERLNGLKRPRVGLVWRGNPGHPNDRNRSMSAATVAALVKNADVDWVSLQLDARAEELAQFAPTPVFEAGPLLGDWADTAAVVDQLDLVVTVDTSTAHLAGALGKPVWLMLPFAPDWRWVLGRSDSPWYPTMRLFRQAQVKDWAPVLDAVGAALKDIAAPAPPAAPAIVTARRLPPMMVVSHERSGTHFAMNALSYAYGYTAEPWIDLDDHSIAIDYSDPGQIADALAEQGRDGLMRIVKSHHAAEQFGAELARITADYRIVYVHRDPIATFVSLWRHLNGLAWDEGPKVADPLALAKAAPRGRLTRYQAQPYPTMLRRWSGHVQGWMAAAKDNPRIVPLRYEDLDARYEQTLGGLARVVGRTPLAPMLRPPRDVNVIAMGKTAAQAPVSAATLEALRAYIRGDVGEFLKTLSY